MPPGFAVTTDAFRAAVHEHGLREHIDAALAAADPDDPASVDAASRRIREAFAGTPVPTAIATSVLGAYRTLGGGPVAVRSSATAEDLPDLSFAGQQDTLLGVRDEDALLAAVVECWSSLWTARAITYRRRAGIPEEAAALAVAVQRMVEADTSGVLFTANPLTGHRGQMAIDATFGLGEALVSGLVEPDHVVADATTGRVLERTLGAKAVVTSSLAGGGVETRESDRATESTLSDADVASLVDLGRRVQAEYGTPQDIEWAIAGGEVALLQARAITSLFPVPDGPEEAVYLSFGAVQGMLAPITPSAATPSGASWPAGRASSAPRWTRRRTPRSARRANGCGSGSTGHCATRWAAGSSPGCSRPSTRARDGSSSVCATRGCSRPSPARSCAPWRPSWRGSVASQAATSRAPSATRRPSGRSSTRSPRPRCGGRPGRSPRPPSNPTRSAGSPPRPDPA